MTKTMRHTRNLGACGIFGMLQHDGPPVKAVDVTKAICEVQHDRGSRHGNGIGFMHPNGPKTIREGPLCKIVVREEGSYATMRRIRATFDVFKDSGVEKESELIPTFRNGFGYWRIRLRCDDPELLARLVVQINNENKRDGMVWARVISVGRHSTIYKGTTWMNDLADECGLNDPEITAVGAVGHTRQPTNSLGRPYCSHPFEAGPGIEVMIVHNGEINSAGASFRFLEDTHRMTAFAGPDSELIALLLYHLLAVEKLKIEEAILLLMKPYEREIGKGVYGKLSPEFIDIYRRYGAATLDGPFAVAALIADGEDTYLAGFADRGKLRPLVVGRGGGDYFFVASEEGQIKVVAPGARVWYPEPGMFFLASHRDGLLEKGQHVPRVYPGLRNRYVRERDMPRRMVDKDARIIRAGSMSNEKLCTALMDMKEDHVVVEGLNRHRFVGSGATGIRNLTLIGSVGNLLAEFNTANIEVRGNVADGALSKQSSGDVFIFGQVGDVLMYAADGGRTFVINSVGNRAGILMREYEGSKPVLVVGTRAGAYFGEYMSGGTAIILNMGNEPNPVRYGAASGMVSGKIYIRGKVDRENIGLPPLREDVINCLDVLELDELIEPATCQRLVQEVNKNGITMKVFEELNRAGELSDEGLKRISKLFKDNLKVRHGPLDEQEVAEIREHVEAFAKKFGMEESIEEWLRSDFTTIEPTKVALLVTPEEIIMERDRMIEDFRNRILGTVT